MALMRAHERSSPALGTGELLLCRRCRRDVAVHRRCTATGMPHQVQTLQAVTGMCLVAPWEESAPTRRGDDSHEGAGAAGTARDGAPGDAPFVAAASRLAPVATARAADDAWHGRIATDETVRRALVAQAEALNRVRLETAQLEECGAVERAGRARLQRLGSPGPDEPVIARSISILDRAGARGPVDDDGRLRDDCLRLGRERDNALFEAAIAQSERRVMFRGASMLAAAHADLERFHAVQLAATRRHETRHAAAASARAVEQLAEMHEVHAQEQQTARRLARANARLRWRLLALARDNDSLRVWDAEMRADGIDLCLAASDAWHRDAASDDSPHRERESDPTDAAAVEDLERRLADERRRLCDVLREWGQWRRRVTDGDGGREGHALVPRRHRRLRDEHGRRRARADEHAHGRGDHQRVASARVRRSRAAEERRPRHDRRGASAVSV